MNGEDDQANGHHRHDDTPPRPARADSAASPTPRQGRDWVSIGIIGLALLVLAWNFMPRRPGHDTASGQVTAGQFSPPLRAVDPLTGEPMLGLVPRGWFVWIVLAPDDDAGGTRLKAELERAEAVWKTMADLDQWRRVIVTADARTANDLISRKFEPAMTPLAVGLRRPGGDDAWSAAQRVRHVMIEPTGRILLIEPAETDHPGGLEKIRDDLRRRLRAWEGEFDDLPRFS